MKKHLSGSQIIKEFMESMSKLPLTEAQRAALQELSHNAARYAVVRSGALEDRIVRVSEDGSAYMLTGVDLDQQIDASGLVCGTDAPG